MVLHVFLDIKSSKITGFLGPQKGLQTDFVRKVKQWGAVRARRKGGMRASVLAEALPSYKALY